MTLHNIDTLVLCCLCYFICCYSTALLALTKRISFVVIGPLAGSFSVVYFFYYFQYQLLSSMTFIYFSFVLLSAVFFSHYLTKKQTH